MAGKHGGKDDAAPVLGRRANDWRYWDLRCVLRWANAFLV